MAKWCPVTEENVLYLECNECEEKQACRMGLLKNDEEKENSKNEYDNRER